MCTAVSVVVIVMASCLFAAAGAEAEDAPTQSATVIYNFVARVFTTDGEGDLVHGDRLIRLLPKGIPLSRAYIRPNLGTQPSVECDPAKYQLNIVAARGNVDIDIDIDIVCSYRGSVGGNATLFFGEYGTNFYLLMDRNDIVFVPLGLTFGLGYMKPPLPILSQPKKELFPNLCKKWSGLVYGDGGFDNTLLIMGYYSPAQTFSPGVLRAFAESPYASGKRVIFFVKGDTPKVEELRAEIGSLGAVLVTTNEHVPDDQWHILSQLADASVATGDSSSSDPFFFRSLPFWNCHKPEEATAWFMAATDWAVENDIKLPIIEYIRLLKAHEKSRKEAKPADFVDKIDQAHKKLREATLTDFVGRIDQNFIDRWRLFCEHIERDYTLTTEKVGKVIEIATQMHLLRLASKDAKESAFVKLLELLEISSDILPKYTIDCLKIKINSKLKKLEEVGDIFTRYRYFLGLGDAW